MKSPKIPPYRLHSLILSQPFPLFFKDVYESSESTLLIRNTKYYVFETPEKYRVFSEDLERLTVNRSEYEFSQEQNPKTLTWLIDRTQVQNLSYAAFWSEVFDLYKRFSKQVTKISEKEAILFQDKSYICLHEHFVLSVASGSIFLSRANAHQSKIATPKSIISLDSFYQEFNKAVFELFQPLTQA